MVEDSEMHVEEGEVDDERDDNQANCPVNEMLLEDFLNPS